MNLSICCAIGAIIQVTPIAAAAQQSSPPYHGPHMWGGNWDGRFFGPFMMIAFIAIVVTVIVLLVRWLSEPRAGKSPSGLAADSALDILEKRFAKGEIDEEELNARRRVLEK